MDKVVIRKAKEDDLKDIQELSQQLFIHDQEFIPYLDMNWSYEGIGVNYFKDKISGKTGVCFIADVDGKIVGYLTGGLVKSDSWRTIVKMTELDSMIVADKFRGQKIGKILFEQFMKWSKSIKAERIKVRASAGNFNAIKFYEKIGFVQYATELEQEVK